MGWNGQEQEEGAVLFIGFCRSYIGLEQDVLYQNQDQIIGFIEVILGWNSNTVIYILRSYVGLELEIIYLWSVGDATVL